MRRKPKTIWCYLDGKKHCDVAGKGGERDQKQDVITESRRAEGGVR